MNNLREKTQLAILMLVSILFVVMCIGFTGYKLLFNLNNTDAFYYTAITASTLGIDPHPRTNKEKIFIGIYALLSGVFFIATISTIVSYIFSLYIS